MSRRKPREYSDLERRNAQALADLLTATFSRMVAGHPVDARSLYDQMGIIQPYGFWLHRYVISRYGYTEGAEYVRDGKRVMLTNDAALEVATSSPGLVGACLKVQAIQAVKAHVMRPGNEHLRSMEGMMAEASRQFDESERLKRMLAT